MSDERDTKAMYEDGLTGCSEAGSFSTHNTASEQLKVVQAARSGE